MAKAFKKEFLRIIDANFNRCKEGLRVCEDVCRFIWDNKTQTKKIKNIRHRLTGIIENVGLVDIVKARNIAGDVGKKTTPIESQRKNIKDVFYANIQRVKESMRVLEELTKLENPSLAEDLKKLRYHIYALEKEIVSGL